MKNKLIALAALVLAPGMVGASDNVELNRLKKADVAAVQTAAPAVLQQTGVEKIVGGVEAIIRANSLSSSPCRARTAGISAAVR